MKFDLIASLERWKEAGLLDPAQADRILAFESAEGGRAPGRLRLPAIMAIAFGVLMVGAGVLLFVAAHWEDLGPAQRFTLVLAQVAAFHLAGAWFAERVPNLATGLHAAGTLALGAGIFLAGQIFNLQEHWPGGVLLWALGAWAGVALLRDWAQAALAALLTPFWLAGEWTEATRPGWWGARRDGPEQVLAVGVFFLAVTYLTCRFRERDGLPRRALAWIGGLALVPSVLFLLGTTDSWGRRGPEASLGTALLAAGWTLALGMPLALAAVTRGKAAWMNAAAAGWALLLVMMGTREWPVYAWCALGSAGLVGWGLHEARRERVNLGVAGFALTLVWFYFSSVMDKLGRSLGLMILGLLFLAGGWQLERVRRRLNALITREGRP